MSDNKTTQRRHQILEILNQNGEVDVIQLAALFGVSRVTIRNDLNEMGKENLLQRIHSGALSIKSTNMLHYDAMLNDRMNTCKKEKIRIAKACMGLINDGDTVMIDSGTTPVYVARELSAFTNLTVITNAFMVARELLANHSIKVIFLGGDVDLAHQFTYGPTTITQLNKYRADKLILATDGISSEHGFTTYHHQEADVIFTMIQRANQVIVVSDHSKIGKEGFFHVVPISALDILVTDSKAKVSGEIEKIKNENVKIITC